MFDPPPSRSATAAVLKTIVRERSTEKGPWESSSPSFLPLLSTGRTVFCFCVTSGAGSCCPAQTKLKEQVQTRILHLPCSDLATKLLRWLDAFRRFKAGGGGEERKKKGLCSIVSVLHCLFKIRNAWTASRCLPLSKGFRCMHRDSGAILPWAAGQTWLGEKRSFSEVLWLLSVILSLRQWQQHICRGETWRLSPGCPRPPRRQEQLQVQLADGVMSVCGWLGCLYLFWSSLFLQGNLSETDTAPCFDQRTDFASKYLFSTSLKWMFTLPGSCGDVL